MIIIGSGLFLNLSIDTTMSKHANKQSRIVNHFAHGS